MAGIYLSRYILARDLVHPNSRDKYNPAIGSHEKDAV